MILLCGMDMWNCHVVNQSVFPKLCRELTKPALSPAASMIDMWIWWVENNGKYSILPNLRQALTKQVKQFSGAASKREYVDVV